MTDILDNNVQNPSRDLLTPTDLGHVFGQTAVQGNFSSPAPVFSTSGFIGHLFYVIGGQVGPRIGRGDFIIGFSLLSSLGSIVTLLISMILGYVLLGTNIDPNIIYITLPILPLIIMVTTFVLQINLLAKRFHDLNKPGSHWIDVILGPIVIIVLSGIASTLFGPLFFDSSSVGFWIFSTIMVLGFLRIFYLGLILVFRKGSTGINTYGEDPLVIYGYPNYFYRWSAVVLLCAMPLVQIGIGFIIYASDSMKILLHISSR